MAYPAPFDVARLIVAKLADELAEEQDASERWDTGPEALTI